MNWYAFFMVWLIAAGLGVFCAVVAGCIVLSEKIRHKFGGIWSDVFEVFCFLTGIATVIGVVTV